MTAIVMSCPADRNAAGQRDFEGIEFGLISIGIRVSGFNGEGGIILEKQSGLLCSLISTAFLYISEEIREQQRLEE
ncbi:hypothetical protein [Paenibacillus sp. cl141a]|uniref:hypothetical protein n=1 Tax=Paenibacillus sp. cl141a TaxID=1761877 RepID=UPI000B8246A7|nr:hypothetical protein [Paenibacillus sp. cl141a]